MPTRLFSRNVDADTVNMNELAALGEVPSRTFVMSKHKDGEIRDERGADFLLSALETGCRADKRSH